MTGNRKSSAERSWIVLRLLFIRREGKVELSSRAASFLNSLLERKGPPIEVLLLLLAGPFWGERFFCSPPLCPFFVPISLPGRGYWSVLYRVLNFLIKSLGAPFSLFRVGIFLTFNILRLHAENDIERGNCTGRGGGSSGNEDEPWRKEFYV